MSPYLSHQPWNMCISLEPSDPAPYDSMTYASATPITCVTVSLQGRWFPAGPACHAALFHLIVPPCTKTTFSWRAMQGNCLPPFRYAPRTLTVDHLHHPSAVWSSIPQSDGPRSSFLRSHPMASIVSSPPSDYAIQRLRLSRCCLCLLPLDLGCPSEPSND